MNVEKYKELIDKLAEEKYKELIDKWEEDYTHCIEMSNELKKGSYPNDKLISDAYILKSFGIRNCINDLKNKTKKNEEETKKRKVAKQMISICGLISLLSLILFVASPFIWIWHDFYLATKVGLTGFIGGIIFNFIIDINEKGFKKQLKNNKTT